MRNTPIYPVFEKCKHYSSLLLSSTCSVEFRYSTGAWVRLFFVLFYLHSSTYYSIIAKNMPYSEINWKYLMILIWSRKSVEISFSCLLGKQSPSKRDISENHPWQIRSSEFAEVNLAKFAEVNKLRKSYIAKCIYIYEFFWGERLLQQYLCTFNR